MKTYKVKIKEKYKGMHLYKHEIPVLYWPEHGIDWYEFMKTEKIMRGLIRNISNYDHKDKFEIMLRNC